MPEGIVADKVAIDVPAAAAPASAAPSHFLLAQESGASSWPRRRGATLDGSGADAGPTQAVVDEIRKAGGEAIGSTLSISEPQNAGAIVRAALATSVASTS